MPNTNTAANASGNPISLNLRSTLLLSYSNIKLVPPIHNITNVRENRFTFPIVELISLDIIRDILSKNILYRILPILNLDSYIAAKETIITPNPAITKTDGPPSSPYTMNMMPAARPAYTENGTLV